MKRLLSSVAVAAVSAVVFALLVACLAILVEPIVPRAFAGPESWPGVDPKKTVLATSPSGTAVGPDNPLPTTSVGTGDINLAEVGGAAFSLGAAAPAAALPVVQDTTGDWTVDTELPAAAALTDADPNPTTPTVGAAGMVWDSVGAVWSRMLGFGGRVSVNIDLVNGAQVTLGQTTASGSIPVTLPSDRSSGTGADDHVTVAAGAETTVLAASATRTFARVQVGLDTNGPICCVAGATTNNCADGVYADAGTAATAGGAIDFPGYSGVITCRSTSGDVVTAVQSW